MFYKNVVIMSEKHGGIPLERRKKFLRFQSAKRLLEHAVSSDLMIVNERAYLAVQRDDAMFLYLKSCLQKCAKITMCYTQCGYYEQESSRKYTLEEKFFVFRLLRARRKRPGVTR